MASFWLCQRSYWNGQRRYRAYCAKKSIRKWNWHNMTYLDLSLYSACPSLPVCLNVDGREVNFSPRCIDVYTNIILASSSLELWWGKHKHTILICEMQSFEFDVRTTYQRPNKIFNWMQHFSATARWKVIALTNNFQKAEVPQSEREFLGWTEGAIPTHLLTLFDDFCDSSRLGMRWDRPNSQHVVYNGDIFFFKIENQNLNFTSPPVPGITYNLMKLSSSMILACMLVLKWLRLAINTRCPCSNLKVAKKLGMDTIRQYWNKVDVVCWSWQRCTHWRHT